MQPQKQPPAKKSNKIIWLVGCGVVLLLGIVILGILVAVAVPQFRKYQALSHSVEAKQSLRRIQLGAKAYLETPRVSSDGAMLPCKFPDSVAATPTASCCSNDGEACQAAPDDWRAPAWRALNFTPPKSHRYRYAIRSTGTGASAVMEAIAYGDLDCDGKYSTFVARVSAREEGRGRCAAKLHPTRSKDKAE